MYTEIQIRIKPEQAGVEETLRQIAARVAGVGAERICRVDIVRKSIDARQKEVMFNLVAGLHIDRIEEKEKVFVPAYRDVSDRETVVVVGAGPAGLFAALRLIERGFRPLVLERGKAVEDRKKDLNGLYHFDAPSRRRRAARTSARARSSRARSQYDARIRTGVGGGPAALLRGRARGLNCADPRESRGPPSL